MDSKINTLKHNQNKLINKYFINQNGSASDKFISNEGITEEYDGYEIHLESYIYDKELRVAYVKMKISKKDIGAYILDNENIVRAVKDMPRFNILASIDNGNSSIGFSKSNGNLQVLNPSNYTIKKNMIEMYYCISDFDGKIYLYDYNSKTFEKTFEIYDTVDDMHIVADGMYLSPLGLLITCDDENQYNYEDEFNIDFEYSDGSRVNINNLYSEEDDGKGYTELTNTKYVYYIFKDIQDIRQIKTIHINDTSYDVDKILG